MSVLAAVDDLAFTGGLVLFIMQEGFFHAALWKGQPESKYRVCLTRHRKPVRWRVILVIVYFALPWRCWSAAVADCPRG